METYEDILESLAEGVVAVDASLKVTVFNQSAENMTETSRRLAAGKPLAEVLPMDPELVEVITRTLTEGKAFLGKQQELLRKYSGPLKVAVTTHQVYSSSGELTGAVAFIRDLSGSKALEEESQRKDRLATIGTFAASLAHELKNPLSGLRGAAQLLGRKATDEKLAKYSDVIMKEADRLNVILNDMLEFARPARLAKIPFNIHKVLDSATLLVGHDFAGKITKTYDPSLPPVEGDEDKLTQVFLNLIKNSAEAAASKGPEGNITVATRAATEFHLVEEGEKTPGKMASFEITDNGSGIGPEEMDKIFTPFFTTKPGGSGLGMAVSLKIIKEHGGFMRINSTPGKGTTVTVYLPLAKE